MYALLRGLYIHTHTLAHLPLIRCFSVSVLNGEQSTFVNCQLDPVSCGHIVPRVVPSLFLLPFPIARCSCPKAIVCPDKLARLHILSLYIYIYNTWLCLSRFCSDSFVPTPHWIQISTTTTAAKQCAAYIQIHTPREKHARLHIFLPAIEEHNKNHLRIISIVALLPMTPLTDGQLELRLSC